MAKMRTGKMFIGDRELAARHSYPASIDGLSSNYSFYIWSIGETLPDGRVLITGDREAKRPQSMGWPTETIAFEIIPNEKVVNSFGR